MSARDYKAVILNTAHAGYLSYVTCLIQSISSLIDAQCSKLGEPE